MQLDFSNEHYCVIRRSVSHRQPCRSTGGETFMNDRGMPSLVVFDLSVTRNSPAGSCILSELAGLHHDYDVTIFSDQCELDEGVHWVRVPLPAGPVFLRYWIFQMLATFEYIVWRMGNQVPDLVQSTQGEFLWPDVCYAHFCHGAYLCNQWKRSTAKGLRRVARRMNHTYNAFVERRAFSHAKKIVVPSHGLAKELAVMYPEVARKIEVIPNPVDVPQLSRPPEFDRTGARNSLGFMPNNRIFSFLALGDFGRKGLDVVIEAFTLLSTEDRSHARILVVGGQTAEIREYQDKVSRAMLSENFKFVGFQKDPRPYLWVSDVFVFPSLYETFSLAIHEAAAAGLPVIVTQGLYGAEEFVMESQNGWIVPRTAEGVCTAMRSALELGDELAVMAHHAQDSVKRYGVPAFLARWGELYAGLTKSHANY